MCCHLVGCCIRVLGQPTKLVAMLPYCHEYFLVAVEASATHSISLHHDLLPHCRFSCSRLYCHVLGLVAIDLVATQNISLQDAILQHTLFHCSKSYCHARIIVAINMVATKYILLQCDGIAIK